MFKKYRLLIALFFVCFSQSTFAADKIIVFAASSLTNAMDAIAMKYRQETGTKIVLSFASSASLARQIADGAPANIYLSADEKWMNYVQKEDAIDTLSRKNLLENSLVLVAPLNYPEDKITVNAQWNLAKALKGTRLAVGNPDYVPAGIYAKQSLESLGLWKQAKPLLARANNVRAALALVEFQEAELGIVYKTDADISKKVKIVAEFPADSHLPIIYPMALVKGNVTTAAKGFYQYLQQAEAEKIFKQYGFVFAKS